MALPGTPGNASEGMTRQRFLIRLGAGAAGAIAGYLGGAVLLADSEVPLQGMHEGTALYPALRPGTLFGFSEGMHTLAPEGPKPHPFCAMNDVGKYVAERLDGRTAIADIGQAVAEQFGLKHDVRLEAGIALFVAHLAQLGFLQAPFFLTLYEERELHDQ